jgi:hypothetical protein
MTAQAKPGVARRFVSVALSMAIAMLGMRADFATAQSAECIDKPQPSRPGCTVIGPERQCQKPIQPYYEQCPGEESRQVEPGSPEAMGNGTVNQIQGGGTPTEGAGISQGAPDTAPKPNPTPASASSASTAAILAGVLGATALAVGVAAGAGGGGSDSSSNCPTNTCSGGGGFCAWPASCPCPAGSTGVGGACPANFGGTPSGTKHCLC